MVELAYSVGFVRGAVFAVNSGRAPGLVCRNFIWKGQTLLADGSKQSQTVSLRVGKHSTRIDGPVALVFVRASRCGAEDGVYN